jgi:hypothetical protein
MRIYVSYSHRDKPIVDHIVARLKEDGHDIWIDSLKLRPGDNIQRRIEEGLAQADALIVVISENSFRSQWIQHEFTSMALQQISKQERRIIPVRIDNSAVPSYLADIVYLDLSHDFEAGLDKLSDALRDATPASIAAFPVRTATTAEARTTQIHQLRDALRHGRLTLVCGAGISVGAGIPAWGDLLVRLLETMMERISKDHSLELGKRAATEFQQKNNASSLILGKYLKEQSGQRFSKRNA